MSDIRVAKIIRNGTSLAVVLPASICREMNMRRGDLLVVGVADINTIALRKVNLIDQEGKPVQNINEVPTIKHGK